MTDGRKTTCTPHAGESRKWHYSDGVFIQAVSDDNAGDCTLQFRYNFKTNKPGEVLICYYPVYWYKSHINYMKIFIN